MLCSQSMILDLSFQNAELLAVNKILNCSGHNINRHMASVTLLDEVLGEEHFIFKHLSPSVYLAHTACSVLAKYWQ